MSDHELADLLGTDSSPLSGLSSPINSNEPVTSTVALGSSSPKEASGKESLIITSEDAAPSVQQIATEPLSSVQEKPLEKMESTNPTNIQESAASNNLSEPSKLNLPSKSFSPSASKASPHTSDTHDSASIPVSKDSTLATTTSDPALQVQDSDQDYSDTKPEPLNSTPKSKEVPFGTSASPKLTQSKDTVVTTIPTPTLESPSINNPSSVLQNSQNKPDPSKIEHSEESTTEPEIVLPDETTKAPVSIQTPICKFPRVASESRRSDRFSKRKFSGCSSKEEYVFDRKLGEGTFGEVHKGRHLKTSKVVALKRILMLNEKEGIPITAIREIRILKALSHPNVLSLVDIVFVKAKAEQAGEQFGPNRASIYMVTPFMDHDLSGLIENPKVRFSLPQIKCYMKQLLEGIFYLHNNNIFHRDIKTANLLINNDGILKVADFGLSRPCESPDAEYTSCVVTRWYRPPELFLGQKNYTSSIDMWGVGCVFGQMLQSKPLIPGKTDIEQLDLIFKLCGSPTTESFPGYNELPNSDTITFNHYPRRILEHFSGFDQYAVDLLDQLLVLNPKKRITANNALSHYFFYMDPLPAHPSSLPKYDSSHEYDRRSKDEARNSRGPGPVRNFSSGNGRTRDSGLGLHRRHLDSQGRDSGPKRVRHGHANNRNLNGQGISREDSFRYNAVGGRNFGPGAWSRAHDDP